MRPLLSILTVSRAENYALPFLSAFEALAANLAETEFVLAADGEDALARCKTEYEGTVIGVTSKGYIESVLDEAIAACQGEFILRLDDDEMCSPAMIQWLHRVDYLEHDHWKFPRVHLWPNTKSAILTPHLFPDCQTRLSTHEKSGGRTTIHAGSPFGGGVEAPVSIDHHKFIVKTYDERKAIAERYDAVTPGYGTGGMLPFSLPEDAYGKARVVSVGDGTVPWTPTWEMDRTLYAAAKS